MIGGGENRIANGEEAMMYNFVCVCLCLCVCVYVCMCVGGRGKGATNLKNNCVYEISN